MYTLLHAKGLDKLSLGDWSSLTDIGNQPLFTLFLRYENVLLSLSNPDSLEQGWVSILQFPVAVRTSGVTLSAYLLSLPSYTLSLYREGMTLSKVSGKPNYVRSLFANDYGFTQRMINRYLHPDSSLAPDQQLDLLIQHPDIIDYTSIVDNAVFTVNGLLHQAVATDDGILIYEGARTMVKSKDNRVGILDFKALGGVTIYPFKDDYLHVYPGKDVTKTAYFSFPFSLDGKSVLLSLGGFLYFIDPVLDTMGGNKIKVNVRFIDLVSQYYANVHRIYRGEDFPLTRSTTTDDLIDTREIHTEAYLRATLSLSQSFFIVVNTPRLTVSKTRLDQCFDAGIYRTIGKHYPDLPVRIGVGFLPEFNVLEREHFYVLSCPHYLVSHPFRHTVPVTDVRYTRDLNVGYHAYDHAEAAQLLITAG